MTATEVDPRYRVAATARTIELLKTLAAIDRPVPLSELVEKLPWSKQTTYRMLRTLEAEGAVRRGNDGYVLGGVMVTIGQAALREINFHDVAHPHLQRLHDELGETVNLGVLEGSEVLYVDRIEIKQILTMRVDIGSRLPAFCTSLGHALLAALPDEEVRLRLAETKFEGDAPNAIRSIDDLLERLEEARQRGFSLNDEMLAAGQRSIGAPVHDHGGKVVAAINVSVSAYQFSPETMVGMAPGLLETARQISADLGVPSEAD